MRAAGTRISGNAAARTLSKRYPVTVDSDLTRPDCDPAVRSPKRPQYRLGECEGQRLYFAGIVDRRSMDRPCPS